MNILITSGGTTEQIDSVRSITNTSTGMLGSLIANAFDKIPDTKKIYYVCGKNAVVPQSANTEILRVDTVASLEAAVRKVTREVSIDIIVHSMAVSDYRVKSVTSAKLLADSVKSKLESQKKNKPISDTFIESLLESPPAILNADGKISSNVDDLILCMEKTPKIISLFQSIAPDALLVGFKLLDHVPLDTLIDMAFHILQENKCSFVLANDLRDITGKQHIGYLVDENKNYTRFTTKADIASAIAAVTYERRTAR